MDEFEVIVLGAGPAGETAAGRCADGGLRVAVAERELVGGECSFWGCVPSKTLIRPGDVRAAARRVPGAATAVDGPLDVGARTGLARRDDQRLAGRKRTALARGEGDHPARWQRTACRQPVWTTPVVGPPSPPPGCNGIAVIRH